MIIDFHTHILPGIDDGSRDIDMTRGMLMMESGQGVTHVFATPHYNARRRSVSGFLEQRDAALEETRRLVETLPERPEVPAVIAGAEVRFFPGISRFEYLSRLCIEGTDLLLLEMPFDQWHMSELKEVEEILTKRKLRVVLAHVERYDMFQKAKWVRDRVLDLPVTLQLNCGPFTYDGPSPARQRMRDFCFEIIEARGNIVIGTDCHDTGIKKPDMAAARAAIKKTAGDDRLKELDEYAVGLLGIYGC